MLIADIPQSFSGPADWKERIDKRKGSFVGSDRGIAFARMDKKNVVNPYSNQPCHGALSGTRGLLVATSIYGRPSDRDSEAKKVFLDWWVNRSYASGFIMNAATYLEDEYIAVTGDLWFPFMNCLNIVNRSIYEKPWQFKTFYDLVQKGVPEEVAFVVCFSTTYTDQKTVIGKNTNKVYYQGSHCPFGSMSVEGLKNFFRQDAPGYKPEKTGWFSTDNGNFYGGIHSFVTDGDTKNWMSEFYDDKTFRKAIAVFRKEEVAAFKNPFRRTNMVASPSYYNVEEYDDVVIPFMTEIYHQCLKESCQ